MEDHKPLVPAPVRPTIIAALPLYGYSASRLRNSDGDVVNSSPDIGAFLLGVGGSVRF